MPEGDVVWRTARELDAALSGQVLTRSDFRVPRFATTNLAGRAVSETVPRGKHILTRVDGEVTVHTHLRMDGSWRIRRASGYPPRDHRIRLVLANAAWQAVGYLLGIVEVVPTAREDAIVGHLGPDLLGPDWDATEAVVRLRAQPDRPVGEAVLDQRNLAGIGNLYKAEVLFLRGISPWRPAGEIDDLNALVELARRLLDANKERVGQVTTGDQARGNQTWVYGRAGQPCRRCGSPVQRANQGTDPEGRITFWCPTCQRLPPAREELAPGRQAVASRIKVPDVERLRPAPDTPHEHALRLGVAIASSRLAQAHSGILPDPCRMSLCMPPSSRPTPTFGLSRCCRRSGCTWPTTRSDCGRRPNAGSARRTSPRHSGHSRGQAAWPSPATCSTIRRPSQHGRFSTSGPGQV